MKKETPQGFLFLMLISPISFFLSLTAQRWLPEQFLRDSSLFNERLSGSITGYSDTFSIVSNLYGVLSISLNSTLLSVFQWGFSVLPLILLNRIVNNPYENMRTTLIAGLYLMLIPVYLSSYSKEFLVVLSVNLILLLFWKYKSEAQRVFSFVAVLLSLTIIRQYYFLTLFLTLILVGVVWRIKSKWVPFLLVFAATIIFTFEAFTRIGISILGINILDLRFNAINNSPVIANSSIYAEVYDTSILGNLWINIKVISSIVIPFQLSQINLYTLVATSITWLLIYSYYSQIMSSRSDVLSLRMLSSFLFSYLLVALIFEPDVGSFNRHSFPWLPLILILSSTRRNYAERNVSKTKRHLLKNAEEI